MIDELREEAIVNKVGGRFKLSTLIQKRMVAINGGARPLVDMDTDNKMEIVIQEILQDKIYLDSELKVQVVGAAAGRTAGTGLSEPMNGRNVLIGVTGGIAAFKTAALVSRLVQAGASVSVIMTRAATRLVGPKTFEALTGRPVGTSVFGPGAHPHIEVAEAAEVFCVAPATANILAKAACGLADDLVSTVLLVVRRADHHGPGHERQDVGEAGGAAKRRPASRRRRRAGRSRRGLSQLRGHRAPAGWPRRSGSSRRLQNS